jgi:hypothetical protein
MTTIDLGYRPREWQRQVHLAMKRFTVLALHRRAGKTELALRHLLDRALRCEKDLGLFFYVAPLLKQAKTIAWTRLKQITAPLVMHGLAETNESELWVRLKTNGAVIRLYGADNGDAMRGVRLDGVVLDEVADIRAETWREVLQPALADRLGFAVFIGTPHGINLFSELFFKARNLDQWHAALYTVYDTDALNPTEVERYRQSVDENTFKREMLCDFAASGDDQLMSLTDVQEASRRHLRKDEYTYAPKILGVDPARFGDDRSVIFARQGLYAMAPKVYRGINNMTLADKVAQEIERFQPDAVFIDAGNGGGVIDRLRQLHHDVIEVHFSGSPSNARYLNKRAEIWFEVRDWLRAGGAIPDLVDLKQDLAAPTYRFTPADKIQLESKDDIKARGLPSPDMGDALALTFSFPVYVDHSAQARARSMGLPTIDEANSLDYDPYRRL